MNDYDALLIEFPDLFSKLGVPAFLASLRDEWSEDRPYMLPGRDPKKFATPRQYRDINEIADAASRLAELLRAGMEDGIVSRSPGELDQLCFPARSVDRLEWKGAQAVVEWCEAVSRDWPLGNRLPEPDSAGNIPLLCRKAALQRLATTLRTHCPNRSKRAVYRTCARFEAWCLGESPPFGVEMSDRCDMYRFIVDI